MALPFFQGNLKILQHCELNSLRLNHASPMKERDAGLTCETRIIVFCEIGTSPKQNKFLACKIHTNNCIVSQPAICESDSYIHIVLKVLKNKENDL